MSNKDIVHQLIGFLEKNALQRLSEIYENKVEMNKLNEVVIKYRGGIDLKLKENEKHIEELVKAKQIIENLTKDWAEPREVDIDHANKYSFTIRGKR